MNIKSKVKKGTTIIELTLVILGSIIVGVAGLKLINSQGYIQTQLNKIDSVEKSVLTLNNLTQSLGAGWSKVTINQSSNGHIEVEFRQDNSIIDEEASGSGGSGITTNYIVLYTVSVVRRGIPTKQIRAKINNQNGQNLIDVEITQPLYDSVKATINGPLLEISTTDIWGGAYLARMPRTL